MHHALGQGRGHDQADIGTASRLAEDSYPVRITTEIRDVCLHPLQYLQLIEDAVVTRRIVFGLSSKGRMRKKTQRPQAIIGGNYYCAPRRQVGTVEYERAAVASVPRQSKAEELAEDILAWQDDEGVKRVPKFGREVSDTERHLADRWQKMLNSVKDLSPDDVAVLKRVPGYDEDSKWRAMPRPERKRESKRRANAAYHQKQREKEEAEELRMT